MGKNSILIVDDDLILLKTAEEILSSIYGRAARYRWIIPR